MKKTLLISIGIVVSLFTTSCDKQLDKQPYNALNEADLFSKPQGFTNAIRAVYGQFIQDKVADLSVYYGSGMMAVPDILTDNLILNTTGRQSRIRVYEWKYSPISPNFSLYESAYKVVHNANVILKNINNLEEGDFKNNIEGEALTARALAHFDLVRTYAKIPTQSSDAKSSLGIAYVKTVDDANKPARDVVSDVYDNIILDLLTALDKIADNNAPGRFDKNTVNALLSRVYLYNGEFQKAVDAANNVSASVASIDEFPNVWLDKSNAGILGEILVRQEDRVAIGNQYSQTGPSGVKSEYNCSYELYQLYKNNDIRKSSYISTSPFAGNNYNHVSKYFGKSGQVNGKVNAKIIRMAEVMLNKAEALSEIPGQDSAALAALDAVRTERYTGFTSGGETGQALKDAIALERRLELAFEGHRFYDIKRKGEDNDRNATFGDLADGSGTPPAFTSMKANDHRFQYAIPEQAILANSNLKQNSGY